MALGLKTVQNNTNEYNWTRIDSVPTEGAAVIVLGGDGSSLDRVASGYSKVVEEILSSFNLKVPIYSAIYEFEHYRSGFIERKLEFYKYYTKRFIPNLEENAKLIKETAREDNFNPQYISNLYKQIIEPRISKKNGTIKLSEIEALKKIRELTFFAHCHGAFVALKIEHKMRNHMENIGYSSSEIKNIQEQMVIIAHSPSAPLGIARSSMYSFASNKDGLYQRRYNIFNSYLQSSNRKNNLNTNPCYFAKKQGNLFLIENKYPLDVELKVDEVANEHDIKYLHNSNPTKSGIILNEFATNIFINCVKNSIKQKNKHIPLPPIEKLILGESKSRNEKISKLFERWSKNGCALRTKINKTFLLKKKMFLQEYYKSINNHIKY